MEKNYVTFKGHVHPKQSDRVIRITEYNINFRNSFAVYVKSKGRQFRM